MAVLQTPKSSKEVILQRMKEFSYYLTTYVENDLNFFSKLLNDRDVPKKATSVATTFVSAAATQIPLIGKVVSQNLKEGEAWICNKLDRKHSKRLADLVFFHVNHKDEVRKMLIEAAIETFFCFEYQFRNLTCAGGPTRAMHKLAKDTAHRILTYLIQEKPDTATICKDDFCKGVVFGRSLRNKYYKEEGKTVRSGGTKWTTLELYTKVGLFVEDSHEFFRRRHCDCDKYGYRRIFPWEKEEEVRKKWPRDDDPRMDLNLVLKRENLEGLVTNFREYIMRQDRDGMAQLDREKKHEEAMNDRKEKHKKTLDVFMETNDKVIDEICRCYQEIEKIRSGQGEIVSKLDKQMELEQKRHEKVDEKLTNIHCEVQGVGERQVRIERNTEVILEAVRDGERSVDPEQVRESVIEGINEFYMGVVNTVQRNEALKRLVANFGKTFNVNI